MAEIDAAEARKQAIVEQYCSPGFFEHTRAEEIAALRAEEVDLERKLKALMAEWEEIEDEIAALGMS